MRKLLIRTLSGIVYVILTIGSILLGKVTFLLYFSFVMLVSVYEFYRLCHQKKIYPQFIVGMFLSFVLFASVFAWQFGYIGLNKIAFVSPLFLLIPVAELIREKNYSPENMAFTILGMVFIALPFTILNFLVTFPFNGRDVEYVAEPLIGLFILLWANDSGAYLIGSQFGKHKMAVKISPNKTWEGAIGGGIVAVGVALALSRFSDLFSMTDAVVLGILTVVFGTLGDLTESLMKRRFGVKDSGTIMPGHGGLLDRFDSLLFSAPVFYLYMFLTLK